ncbi:MAG: VIT1/CCC1 transporter family protein [Patescibacteria group bacterium]
MKDKYQKTTYLRNLIFGGEDSLASVVGLAAGGTAAGLDTSVIFLSGFILIMVEAVAMSAGSLISENSTIEYNTGEITSLKQATGGSLAMFASYIIFGFIPLLPFVFISQTQNALILSTILALTTLGLMGFLAGTISGISRRRKAFQFIIIGGLAIGLGYIIGYFGDYLINAFIN